MIKPSPELIAIARRWTEAIMHKDDRTLINLLSDSAHVSYIGTAVGEHWSGDILRRGLGDHVREIPDFTQEEQHVEAFECGPFGWSHWRGLLTFSNMEQPAPIRTTLVFVLEGGSWKITHQHGSNPSRNNDVIGVEHSAINALIDAAKEGFRQDQREGMASIMFTDIANSSGIAELLGDRMWASTIQAHLDAVTREIEGHGGRLVKSLGDGTMSTFISAGAALAAATGIQQLNNASTTEPQLQLRIGVHTGDVIQTEDDFFGTVVNKAARIAAAASPDEIRVSDATRLMVGSRNGFAFSPPRQVVLKGLPGEHVLYSLSW